MQQQTKNHKKPKKLKDQRTKNKTKKTMMSRYSISNYINSAKLEICIDVSKTTENYKKSYKRGTISENFHRLKIHRKDSLSKQYHSRIPVDASENFQNSTSTVSN